MAFNNRVQSHRCQQLTIPTLSLYNNMGIFRNIFSSLTGPAVASSSKAATTNDRASSEPLPTKDTTPSDVHRSQSELYFPLSEVHVSLFSPTFHDDILITLRFQTKPLALDVIEEEAQPSQLQCPPSPAATEIDFPESQDIMNDIQVKGIKVHDFAYSSAVSRSAPRLSPIPEIFDQYKGLAEVEYRWKQPHRTYPIQGKTLSRLIDMGWIGQEELSARAAPMDLEELRKHNARQPMYPWKPFQWTTIPTAEKRLELANERAPYLYQWDKMRAQAEFQEVRRLRLERETEEVEERIRERERQTELALSQTKGKGKQVVVESAGHKRRFEADDNDDDSVNTLTEGESDISTEGTETKRRRLSEELEDVFPAFLIPSKQYPAALHTYDPEIYPEAVYAIGSQSQSRPVVPPRTDTPPLSDDEDTRRKLVHPKTRALKRQLSRMQTYRQL